MTRQDMAKPLLQDSSRFRAFGKLSGSGSTAPLQDSSSRDACLGVSRHMHSPPGPCRPGKASALECCPCRGCLRRSLHALASSPVDLARLRTKKKSNTSHRESPSFGHETCFTLTFQPLLPLRCHETHRQASLEAFPRCPSAASTACSCRPPEGCPS